MNCVPLIQHHSVYLRVQGHTVVVFSDKGEFQRRIGFENITNFPNGIDVSGRQIDRHTDRQTGFSCCSTDFTGRQIDVSDSQTDRQTDRLLRLTNRQTDRQMSQVDIKGNRRLKQIARPPRQTDRQTSQVDCKTSQVDRQTDVSDRQTHQQENMFWYSQEQRIKYKQRCAIIKRR